MLGCQDDKHVNLSTPNQEKLSNDDIKYMCKFEHTKLDFEHDSNVSKMDLKNFDSNLLNMDFKKFQMMIHLKNIKLEYTTLYYKVMVFSYWKRY